MAKEQTYLAIDLKSFYASVECVERGLDPLQTHLVVADPSRTDKTICLAVTPSLKAFGISGRARLYQVKYAVQQINADRLKKSPLGIFLSKSINAPELESNSSLELDFLIAPPRMQKYLDYSTKIFSIYSSYVSPEDIHVYSIDEVFMDITDYLKVYKKTPHELAETIIKDIFEQTGITATAGIGENLYLAKIAMDIVAKHLPADKNGARIAELTERSYREQLWDHTPITDFWRIGPGTSRRLARLGIKTMGELAKFSLFDSEKLYSCFGVNAELLIDHSWGWEPTTIQDIKAYKTNNRSIGSGQVLATPYSHKKARLVIQEMADQLALDLFASNLITDQIIITLYYDHKNLQSSAKEHEVDYYGRVTPKHSHGSVSLKYATDSSKILVEQTLKLFDCIAATSLTVRRLQISFNHVRTKISHEERKNIQLDFFTNYEKLRIDQDKEAKQQKAILAIKKRYGKNSILKAFNLEEGATMRKRNGQIGGHKA